MDAENRWREIGGAWRCGWGSFGCGGVASVASAAGCGFGASLFASGARALRLSSHPGAAGPTQPLGTLPLLALPAPVLRAGQVPGRQQNHGALGAFPHRRPRTSRRLRSGALRGCSGDRPPCGHGRGRCCGRPTEHMESLCVCEGAVPAAQSPAYSGLACALLARGGRNAGQRVPVRLPEVRSGETELPPGVWPSRQRLGLALPSTPVGSGPTRWTAESRRSPARRAGSQRLATRRTVSVQSAVWRQSSPRASTSSVPALNDAANRN